MKNEEHSEPGADNPLLLLWKDVQELLPLLKTWLRAKKITLAVAAIGLTITIGSTGLLMGALTTALASYMMSRGMEMVPAMNVGFFTVGFVSLLAGATALLLAIKGLRK